MRGAMETYGPGCERGQHQLGAQRDQRHWTASFLDVYAITYAIASGEDPTRAGPRPRGGLASVRHADRGPPECIGETAEVYVHALDVKTAVFTITLWPIACSTSD